MKTKLMAKTDLKSKYFRWGVLALEAALANFVLYCGMNCITEK